MADSLPTFVVDPTCGGGAFLLAVLDAFVQRGAAAEVALERVGGIDVDASAVATCRRVVEAWAAAHGVSDVRAVHDRVVVGDALAPWPADWPTPDLIVGNPPFASPLRVTGDRTSAALPEVASAFRRTHADVLGPYADLAAIHLLSAGMRLAPTGRIAMVLPQSMLAGRDAAALRAWFDARFPIETMWISAERHFDAAVRVCAPVLAGPGVDLDPTDLDPTDVEGARWADAAAGAMGVPDVSGLAVAGRLGSMARATAGFRDEYYALADACVERRDGSTGPRLATVGSIDPLEFRWGTEPIRFAKSVWHRPSVDVGRFDERWTTWLEAQLQPKVLLPTQARVLEPYVDSDGDVVPVTPLISVLAEPADLDRVAAVLLAPAVVAWAARRSFGSALSTGALKLRAADVLDIPLPADDEAWAEAASLVAEGPGAVERIGASMQRAYGADSDVLEWWAARLPRR